MRKNTELKIRKSITRVLEKKSTAVGRAGAGVGKVRARPLAKPGRSPRLVVYISL